MDADGAPAGMLATEIEDRLEQRVSRAGLTAAGGVAGGQIGVGAISGLRLGGASDQVADGADGQIESPSDLRRGEPEPGQASDGEAL